MYHRSAVDVINDAALDEIWNLNRHPCCEAEDEGVSDAKARGVPSPERVEVIRQANLPTSIHLVRLTVQLGEAQLGRRRWVRYRNLKRHLELVLQRVDEDPALSLPPRPNLVRRDREPILIVCFVHLHQLDDRDVLHTQTVNVDVGAAWKRHSNVGERVRSGEREREREREREKSTKAGDDAARESARCRLSPYLLLQSCLPLLLHSRPRVDCQERKLLRQRAVLVTKLRVRHLILAGTVAHRNPLACFRRLNHEFLRLRSGHFQ